LAGALAGLGAGVADARPMERDNKKYCAKVLSDYERTGAIYRDYINRYGLEDRLTQNAGAIHVHAANTWAASSC
jgi:hypothetical protein